LRRGVGSPDRSLSDLVSKLEGLNESVTNVTLMIDTGLDEEPFRPSQYYCLLLNFITSKYMKNAVTTELQLYIITLNDCSAIISTVYKARQPSAFQVVQVSSHCKQKRSMQLVGEVIQTFTISKEYFPSLVHALRATVRFSPYIISF
jgi:hypothetical protein